MREQIPGAIKERQESHCPRPLTRIQAALPPPPPAPPPHRARLYLAPPPASSPRQEGLPACSQRLPRSRSLQVPQQFPAPIPQPGPQKTLHFPGSPSTRARKLEASEARSSPGLHPRRSLGISLFTPSPSRSLGARRPTLWARLQVAIRRTRPRWVLISLAENEGLGQTNPTALGGSEGTLGKPHGPKAGVTREDAGAESNPRRAGAAQAVEEASAGQCAPQGRGVRAPTRYPLGGKDAAPRGPAQRPLRSWPRAGRTVPSRPRSSCATSSKKGGGQLPPPLESGWRPQD